MNLLAKHNMHFVSQNVCAQEDTDFLSVSPVKNSLGCKYSVGQVVASSEVLGQLQTFTS